MISTTKRIARSLFAAITRAVHSLVHDQATGKLAPLALVAVLGGTSCQALSNLNFYTLDDDVTLGAQAFEEVAGTEPLISSGPQLDQVERVTERLVLSAEELHPEIATHFQWEVVLIDNPETVNAWCLPGGKMAVYTGILPVTQTDAGLAVVMGHEITHAIERHGTERLTRNGLLGSAIEILTENEDQAAVASVLANLGVGLPWGRNDELEADREGLFILANAGYDPREAPAFWQRMSDMSGGGGSGLEEYFSTHPSHERRIEQLSAAVPEAMQLYESYSTKNSP